MNATTNPEHPEKGTTLRILLKRPHLLIFAILVMFMNIVYAQLSFSLPLSMNQFFGENGPSLYGSTMSINALIVIIGTTFILYISRKLKPLLATALASLLYGLGFGLIYFGSSYAVIIISVFIWTIGEVLSATNVNVYIADNTPMSHRGRINSIVPLIMDSGHAISPYITGQFIERYSLGMVWPLCFMTGLLAFLGLSGLYRYERKKRLYVTHQGDN